MSLPRFSVTYSLSDIFALRHNIAQRDGRPTRLIVQPARDLSGVRERIVVSGYVAALQPELAAKEPNSWILVLTTMNESDVVIEIRESDPKGSTVVVCREESHQAEDRITRNCVRSWPLMIRERRNIGFWLDVLENSGSLTYRLNDGYGSRWWLDCVLSELSSLAGYGDAKLWLRMAWNRNGEPQGGMQNLPRGTWI